jgi:hypothetical protein
MFITRIKSLPIAAFELQDRSTPDGPSDHFQRDFRRSARPAQIVGIDEFF